MHVHYNNNLPLGGRFIYLFLLKKKVPHCRLFEIDMDPSVKSSNHATQYTHIL